MEERQFSWNSYMICRLLDIDTQSPDFRIPALHEANCNG